jgi:hypothetical protein
MPGFLPPSLRVPGQDFFLVLEGLIVAAAFVTTGLDDCTSPVVQSPPWRAPFALSNEVRSVTNNSLRCSIRVRHSLLLIRNPLRRGTAN